MLLSVDRAAEALALGTESGESYDLSHVDVGIDNNIDVGIDLACVVGQPVELLDILYGVDAVGSCHVVGLYSIANGAEAPVVEPMGINIVAFGVREDYRVALLRSISVTTYIICIDNGCTERIRMTVGSNLLVPVDISAPVAVH